MTYPGEIQVATGLDSRTSSGKMSRELSGLVGMESEYSTGDFLYEQFYSKPASSRNRNGDNPPPDIVAICEPRGDIFRMKLPTVRAMSPEQLLNRPQLQEWKKRLETSSNQGDGAMNKVSVSDFQAAEALKKLVSVCSPVSVVDAGNDLSSISASVVANLPPPPPASAATGA